MQIGATTLLFKPCLPSHWPRAELSLRRDDRTMRFILARAPTLAGLRASVPASANVLWPGEPLAWATLRGDTCFVVPLLDAVLPLAVAPASVAQPG